MPPDADPRPRAAVITVGSELVAGLRLDTNSAEIASALTGSGYRVVEIVSVADDERRLTDTLEELSSECALVVVTGGLGPTHDDITRAAASEAFARPLARDESLVERLREVAARHRGDAAAEQVYAQADVLEGARVLKPIVGTAPGQLVPTEAGWAALLPGPPREMRPMLAEVLREVGGAATQPLTIGCVGISESDAVLTAQDVLAGREGIGLGVLAQPGDVQLVLFDEGAGARPMSAAAEAVCAALGDSCYAGDGKTLAEAVIRRAERAGRSIAVAESCTGGMIAAALTSVPGSSAVFLGGVVAYSNEVKSSLLGVPTEVLAEEGAVSKGVVEAMAVGALRATGADLAVATTGIAGPDGGTPEKPVGTVWFAVAGPGGAEAVLRTLPGDRTTVRMRATAAGLDMLRLAIDPPGR